MQQSYLSRALCGRCVSGLRVELLCTTHCLNDYALEAVTASASAFGGRRAQSLKNCCTLSHKSWSNRPERKEKYFLNICFKENLSPTKYCTRGVARRIDTSVLEFSENSTIESD